MSRCVHMYVWYVFFTLHLALNDNLQDTSWFHDTGKKINGLHFTLGSKLWRQNDKQHDTLNEFRVGRYHEVKKIDKIDTLLDQQLNR